MKNHILLVDDDSLIFETLDDMKFSNVMLHFIENPDLILEYMDSNKIDLILMDFNIKHKSGTDYIKQIRQRRDLMEIPIIMLTGNSKDSDVISGLQSGADDYVTKPFKRDVLEARIQAGLRRKQKVCKVNSAITFDENIFQIEIRGKKINLRKKEFHILKALVDNPGVTISRQELNALTTGPDVHVSDRSIDTFVRYLRIKLPLELIVSVRGNGYKIDEKGLAELLK